MKPIHLLVLACLVSPSLYAQNLPDEINYPPYQASYNSLVEQTRKAQANLEQNKKDLRDIQKFIIEMTSHISELESDISNSQSEISRLERAIPDIQRQISTLQYDRTRAQNDINSLKSSDDSLFYRIQAEKNNLRPLEDNLARKEQRLRDTQQELSRAERTEREAQSNLSRAQSELNQLQSRIEAERQQQRQLKAQLATAESRMNSLRSEISKINSEISTNQSKVNTEKAKLEALSRRVEEYAAEVRNLRASSAPQDKIAEAERKHRAASSTRDNTASEIRSLESKITQLSSQIRSTEAKIEEIRREQASLPQRISQSEATERTLSSQVGSKQTAIAQISRDLSAAQGAVRNREQLVSQIQNDIRNDQVIVSRQRQVIAQMEGQRRDIANSINSLNQQISYLNQQVSAANQDLRNAQAAIPNHQTNIRNNQNEITSGRKELAQAKTDEQAFIKEIATQERNLATLITNRDSAQNQMDHRLDLYNSHLRSAQSIGTSQTGPATDLGKKEGQRLAQVIGTQNGKSIGAELGIAEAKYWAAIRGETEGYQAGYNTGFANSEEISRANKEADLKARADAQAYAQTKLKPVYFEEALQVELKKEIQKSFSLPNLKMFKLVEAPLVEALLGISPPTSQEIEASRVLKTSLDATIKENSETLEYVESKVNDFSHAEFAYQPPTQIPYQTVNCSGVYKGLEVFKQACQKSYREKFSSIYLTATKGDFAEFYNSPFERNLDQSQLQTREAKYPEQYSAYAKISNGEGLIQGKKDVYDQTYLATYKSSYDQELPLAKTKAQTESKIDVTNWITSKPVLTLHQGSLKAEAFRGNEEVKILTAVKNISAKELNGPIVVKITEVQNGSALVGEVTQNTAKGLAVTNLPELTVKVSPEAKTNDRLVIKGTIDLPGDMYKPVRVEKFEYTQVLTANPTHKFTRDYLQYPDIRGVFRRFTHSVKFSITPSAEDILDGYKVTLTPIGATASDVMMLTKEINTGIIKKGETKEFFINYQFQKSAKGKTVPLELKVFFLNKVISSEVIQVQPN